MLLPIDLLDDAQYVEVRKLQVLLRPETLLLPFLCGVRSGEARGLHFLREDVLDREDLIEKLELLLGDLLVYIVDSKAVKVSDMLESVHNERFEGLAGQHFVVRDDEILQGANAFNLREKYEGIQVVVLEDNLLQLCEFLQFL